MGSYIDTSIHTSEYKLNTWVLKNRSMRGSSYDFGAHQQRSQRRCCSSQTALLWFKVLTGLSPELRGLLPVLTGAPRLVVGAPRCSQVYLKATALVQGTLGFDHPGILVWYLSDTPIGSQRHKHILLMNLHTSSISTAMTWCDEPVEMIDWLSLSLRWHVAYILTASANRQLCDDVLYKDSI